MIVFSKYSLYIITFFFICACSNARIIGQGNVISPIEMPSYSILLSPDTDWEKWALKKDSTSETIELMRLNIWPLSGEVQGTTYIAVIKNYVVEPESHNLTEKEHADQLREIEYEDMVSMGEYHIEDLEMNDVTLNDKQLYSMSWKTTKGSAIAASFKRSFFTKSIYCIYFPENFLDTHIFYNFIITESYIPGTFLSIDTDQIYEIINGFQVIDKS